MLTRTLVHGALRRNAVISLLSCSCPSLHPETVHGAVVEAVGRSDGQRLHGRAAVTSGRVERHIRRVLRPRGAAPPVETASEDRHAACPTVPRRGRSVRQDESAAFISDRY